jgi:tRNA G10  N-methylase Trm11
MPKTRVALPSNREIVFEAIQNRLKKGQAFENISNQELTRDIEKKYNYDINYKTLTSNKSQFKVEYPKYKTMHKKLAEKRVVPFKQKTTPSPQSESLNFKMTGQKEFNQLAKSNTLTYVGSVFRINNENEFVVIDPSST